MSNKIIKLKFGRPVVLTDEIINQITITGATQFATAEITKIGGVAMDKSGNIFISDSVEHVIYKLSPEGKVIWIAGLKGTSGINGNQTNIKASDARFNGPQGLVVDNSGFVYVCDTGNNQIRKIDGDRISHVVGSGAGTDGNTNGKIEDALITAPNMIAVNNNGDIYFTETGEGNVKRIYGGQISLIAEGLTGPVGITVNKNGDIFVADNTADLVYKINQNGRTFELVEGLAATYLSSDALTIYASTLGDMNAAPDLIRSEIYRITETGAKHVLCSTEWTISNFTIDQNQDIIIVLEDTTI